MACTPQYTLRIIIHRKTALRQLFEYIALCVMLLSIYALTYTPPMLSLIQATYINADILLIESLGTRFVKQQSSRLLVSRGNSKTWTRKTFANLDGL